MRPSERRVGYAIAIVGCATVLACRLLLSDVLGDRARLFPFTLAITAAAWWGGLWPGIAATLLGAVLGIYFVVPPSVSPRIEHLADGIGAAIFVFVGLTVSCLCHALHRARRSDAEKQFRLIADSIAQLAWTAAPDGDGFWFNERWCDYTGATLAQLHREGWQAFCEPAEQQRVSQDWRSALLAGTAWEEICLLRRADGVMRWHLSRAVPIRDEGGRIVQWCGTSTDIHDRVSAEQALKEADARKDKYIATLAHELRNPLAAISSALELWQRVPKDAAEVETVRTIVSRHVRQLIGLTDDLLDLERFSSGRIVLQRASLNLAATVADAVEAVQPMIAAAGHKLSVTVHDGGVCVDGDQIRLTQVFVNLLQNAAKYTPAAGTIAVLVESRDGQGVVHVRDNGAGIPANLLSEIFTAFYQVEMTREQSQGGLGIGLSLCRRLVELHGGAIEALSAGPGMGSEFVVTLPLMADVAASPARNDIHRAQGMASSCAP